jgi:hypothetical protein
MSNVWAAATRIFVPQHTLSKSIGYMTECSYSDPMSASRSMAMCPIGPRTAMPANAPATMLAAKEKFGGSDS